MKESGDNMTTTVLIINDHVVMRDGLSSVINRTEGMTTVGAVGSSSNTRELIQKLQPDILMLDLQVLGSIFQIANDAKESRPGIKILLTTNVSLPEHQRQAERIGARGLVSSFEDEEQILEGLRTVIAGETYMRTNNVSRALVHKQREGVNNQMDHPLSPREVDVLCCVAQAMTAKEIARDLHISVKTVDRHKANIMNKLSMRSQIELARYAIRNGFVEA
ncbi:MAG: response regulator transcription factor [Oligoflexus sp.]